MTPSVSPAYLGSKMPKEVKKKRWNSYLPRVKLLAPGVFSHEPWAYTVDQREVAHAVLNLSFLICKLENPPYVLEL